MNKFRNRHLGSGAVAAGLVTAGVAATARAAVRHSRLVAEVLLVNGTQVSSSHRRTL